LPWYVRLIVPPGLVSTVAKKLHMRRTEALKKKDILESMSHKKKRAKTNDKRGKRGKSPYERIKK